MKVRKLAVALALAGTMGSNLAYALGLGEVSITSNLNEPLRAEIDLVRPGDLTQDEIIASLAPLRDFERVGIEPMFFLNEIRFNVEKNSRGELILKLTTNKPVREPYLNFLVEVAWPSGRLLREYALLIDPPTFQEGPAEQPRQVTAEPATQPQRAATRQPTVRDSGTPSSQTSSSATQSRARTYGPVRGSDTLWQIAQQVRPSADLTPQQVMLALQDANPDAFLNNNINLLREGSVLRIPSEETIRSRTAREAIQQVSSQNRRFEQSRAPAEPAPIDATDREPTATAESGQSEPGQGDELRLLAGDADLSAEDGSHGGETGGSGDGQANTSLAIAQEQLDKTQRENEELTSRMEALQEQLADMQRLVQLQSDQLASLQASSDEPADAAETGPADGTDGAPAGSADTAGAEGAVAGADESEVADADVTGAEPESLAAADDSAEQTAEQTAAGDAEPGQGEEVFADTDAPQSEADEATEGAATPAVTDADSATDTAADSESQAPVTDESTTTEPQPAAKPDTTSAGLIQQLKDNPVYQIGAAAIGVALLGLLWLLARRNARREEDFYAQLQEEDAQGNADRTDAAAAESGSDEFTTGLADAAAGAGAYAAGDDDSELNHADAEQEDPAAEADVYLAYGRLDQATQVLESAVAREPERTDWRLKLLAIYADGGNEEGFAQHMGAIEASDDEALIAQAETLRERLAGHLDAPSIDDLESELRTGAAPQDDLSKSPEAAEAAEAAEAGQESGWTPDTTPEVSQGADEFGFEEESSGAPQDPRDNAIDFTLDELDLDFEDEPSADRTAAPADEDDLTLEDIAADESSDNFDFNLEEDTEKTSSTDDSLDLDLSDEELEALDFGEEIGLEEAEAAPDEPDSAPTVADEQSEQVGEPAPETESSEDADVAAFDESFLDELDAELEKVTAEDAGAREELSVTDAELDDLELDVSDEDLAFIEEVSGGAPEVTDETDASSDEDIEDFLDFDVGEDDLDVSAEDVESPIVDPLTDENAETAVSGAGDSEEADKSVDGDAEDFDDSLLDVDDSLLDVDDSVLDVAGSDMSDIDEADLEDDDDFNFLEGTDEAATKLDLARAYVEMGDAEGAREILEEVSEEGTDAQQAEARELLGKLA